MIRRMFVVPSFEIHGGVKGLYDFGPPGCGLKSNVVDLWKRHFVLTEGMLEMECTNLTPENVLQTSGELRRRTLSPRAPGCLRFGGGVGDDALPST